MKNKIIALERKIIGVSTSSSLNYSFEYKLDDQTYSSLTKLSHD